MAQHWYYVDPDDGLVEFTDRVNLEDNPSVTTNAEQGSMATSTITVDDAPGDWDFVGHREIRFEEDEATFERVWTGFTAGRTISRKGYRTGAARKWEVELTDINTLLWRKVMAGNDTDRPAETDVERVQWLLGTGEAGFFADVTTYVSTASPVNMDANPDNGYNGQMFQQVLDDCAQQSGKNYYCLDVFDSPDYVKGIWYAHDRVAAFASTLRVSNVISDVDNSTTWYASLDTQLKRDPSRVFSGVFGNYDGGYTYQSSPSVVDAFANRDTVANWPNVKTHAKAVARALRYIGDLSQSEEDVITTTILVPPENVTDIRAGQRMSAKFTHLPGYEEFTDFRVLSLTVSPIAPDVGDQIVYSLQMDLSPIPTAATCLSLVGGLSLWDSGVIAGGPPCAVSPDSPSDYPALVLGFMVMFQDGTAIGPPIVGPGLTVSGFTEVDLYEGAPGAYEHSLLMVASKALSSGSPGSMSCNFTGNGAEGYRSIAVALPTLASTPVQHTKQESAGSTLTLDNPPTPGNMLVMFRCCETGGFTATPGSEWTEVGSSVEASPGHISARPMDVWVHCVQEGDGTNWGNGDASFTHWSFLSEWELT